MKPMHILTQLIFILMPNIAWASEGRLSQPHLL